MRRRIQVGAVAIVIILGLTAHRTLPERLQKVPAMTQPAAAIESVQHATTTTESTETFYSVTKVVDGDTLAVNVNGKNTTIRLIGLDTPETVDPRKPVQCFGREASDKAKEILTGQKVRIEMDPSQGNLDKYGRLLAYVFLEDGTNFNEMMIAEGFGHEYTYNLPYKYQKEFKAAETAALEQRKGLWADNKCGKNVAVPTDSIDLQTRTSDVLVSYGKNYDCSRNAYNCSSFKTQAEAQYVFEFCGGLPAQAGDANDIHKLDRDGDGKVCESLP